MGSSAARPTPYVLKYRFFAPKLASTISMVLCDFSMVLGSKLLPTVFHGALCVCVCVCVCATVIVTPVMQEGRQCCPCSLPPLRWRSQSFLPSSRSAGWSFRHG